MNHKTVLDNGIRVVTEKIPYVHSVATGIWLNVGSRDESAADRGLTHFIEHMLFKGTGRRTALDIAKELDAVGGFANAFTSKEQLCVHAKVLDNHLPLVVDILNDIFLHSTFKPEEIDREREVILQEINMIEDTPDEYVHVLFQEEYWPDNPLGLPIYGSEDTVRGFDRESMVRYMGSMFQAERIIVAAAGNLEHERFVDLVAPALSKLNNGNSPLQRKPPEDRGFFKVAPKTDIEQVHICIGLPGCSQLDEDRFVCHLTNVILGSSMSSRLFQEVREKRGLAYSVYSFLNSHQDAGMLGIYAGVGRENAKDALKVIYEQVARLSEELIPEGELAAAREYVKGSMYLNAESTDSRMNRLAKNEFLFGRLVPFEEVEARINEVTPESIKAWCAGTFQTGGPFSTIVYGPVDPDDAELEAAASGK